MIGLAVQKGRVRLEDLRLKEQVWARQHLGGFWAKNGVVTCDHNIKNWRAIAERFPEVDPPQEALAFLASEPAPDAAALGLIGEHGYAYGRLPKEHQHEVFMKTRDWPAAALFMDAGTGKTKVAIDTACYLWARGEVNVCVVLAPNGVHRKWIMQELPNDVPPWCPARGSHHTTDSLDDADDFINNCIIDGVLGVVAMNVEGMQQVKMPRWLTKVVATNRVLLIVDESTRVANISTARHANLLPIARRSPYVRILTGTPLVRQTDNLYGQAKLMVESVANETTLTGFKARFCITDPDRYNKVVGSRNLDELIEWISTIGVLVDKESCLDLPPKTYLEREAPLTSEQRQHYQRLRTEFLTYLADDTRIDATNILARFMRLQQVCSGFLIHPETREIETLDATPRLRQVEDICREAHRPVVVWATFRNETVRMERYLDDKAKLRVLRYDGSQSDDENYEAWRRFQLANEADVLVASVRKGGIGLDMTIANTAAYYGHTFNAELRWQSEARLDRIGQEWPVTYYDIVAPGTVDRKFISNIRAKAELAQRFKAGMIARQRGETIPELTPPAGYVDPDELAKAQLADLQQLSLSLLDDAIDF